MANINGNRVGMYATWAGAVIKDNGDVFYKLRLPASEIGAAVYIYSLFEHEFSTKVKVGGDWLLFGRCFHKKIVGGEDGESVMEFRSHLSDWHVTAEELLSLKDQSLTVIVKDVSSLNIPYVEKLSANEEENAS